MRTAAPASPRALAALVRALAKRDTDAQPRYRQLRDAVVATIDAGHWKAGDKLPTEAELCAAVPFSLGTVQRALRELVDEGLVTRTQGSGTFVAASYGKVDEVAFCRFLADDGRSLLPVYSKVVSRGRVHGSGPWTPYFPSAAARPTYLERVLNVNGEFDVYNLFYFDAARFPFLAARSLQALSGANLKELLRDELRVPVLGIEERLAITALADAVCRRLGVAPGTVGGVLDGIGRTRDEAVYYQQMFIPPSRRKWVPYAAAVSA
jgi:GntR family transcriptional regulator